MKTTISTLALCVGLLPMGALAQTQELNALVWCDHTDDALIKPFEEKFDVKVNLKEYEGTGAGLSIIEQSQPGDWDVLVIDGIDVPRAVEAGILGPLPVDQLPYDTLFPELVMEANHVIDGKTYAISEKFGYNTVSFDKSKVTAEQMADMTKLWSGEFKGRLAVYDYYLPVMGMVAVGLGMKTADLTVADLPEDRGGVAGAEGFGGQRGRSRCQPDRHRDGRGRYPCRRWRMGDSGTGLREPEPRLDHPRTGRRALVAIHRSVRGFDETRPCGGIREACP